MRRDILSTREEFQKLVLPADDLVLSKVWARATVNLTQRLPSLDPFVSHLCRHIPRSHPSSAAAL